MGVDVTERKKRHPRKLGDVMGDVLSTSGISDRIAQASIIPDWPSLVGPQIAKVTEPLSITRQGTLFVAVTTNAWMTELSLMEPELLRRLNERAGRLQVKKIRWRHTVIETRDWDTLIVPNGQLMGQTIKVLGKRDGRAVNHRMWVYFCVDFRFSPGEVINVVNTALAAAPITGVAG